MLKQEKVRKGQIYYADMTAQYGSEQGGIRPVLIVQNDVGNRYSPTTLIAPLTTKTKKRLPTHVFLSADAYGLKQNSTILLEQISVIDKRRLRNYITYLDADKMFEVNNAIAVSLGISVA